MKIALHLRQTGPDGNRYAIFKAQLSVCWFMTDEGWRAEGELNMKSFTISVHQNLTRMWCKAALASESLFWRHIRGSATSWMGARLKAKKSEGRVCLWCPWERKWRTENTELRARLLLRKPGHPASPSQGPLDTFPPAALRKQTRHCAGSSSVRAPVEYGRAPSTGCLLVRISIHFAWMISKQNSRSRVQSGFNNSIMYDGGTERL